jgi:putative tryptophan/tyrosine transport system substrate-binding protein
MRRLGRRQFLTGSLALAGLSLMSACALPRISPKPQARVWRLGLFHVGLDHVPASLDPLREELAQLGYGEGENLELDWRNLADEAAAHAAAREFVRNGVDLIVAFENQTMRAVKEATSELPVVFLHVDDPVANGWVESLARPGGNLTGFVGAPDLPDKRIEYFKELVPSLRRLLILLDPGDPVTRRVLPAAQQAAATLGIEPVERTATDEDDLDRVFASLAPGAADGVFLASRNLQTNLTLRTVRLGMDKRLPVAAHRKEFVEQGALFSYGPDQATTGRLGAHLVDKILKGAKPADLPVEQTDRIELVINLKVAQALGLTFPQAIVAQAAEVIQ